MSSCSIDANLANGREPHNQNLMGACLFNIYFYFFIFVIVIFYVHFCLINFLLWAFTGLEGITFTPSGYMVVRFSCLKCNRAVAKNNRAVQCNICDKWVHIACNNLNTYTYKNLQKDKSPWQCICCLQKELPYCLIGNDVLNSFMHGNRILSSNPKFTSSVIKHSEYFDEEILEILYPNRIQ